MTETIHLGTYSRSHLGDCLCTTPFPRLLHAREGKRVIVPDNRNSRIVFANNPFVAGFAKGGVPLCSIARGYGHVIQRIAQGLELPIMGISRPEIHLSEEESDGHASNGSNCQVIDPSAYFQRLQSPTVKILNV